jgi:hypothetical protein
MNGHLLEVPIPFPSLTAFVVGIAFLYGVAYNTEMPLVGSAWENDIV